MKRLLPLLALSLVLGTTAAHAKPPPTAPGSYTDWDGELDEVEIVQPFHLRDYNRVLVLPITATGLKLPTDNTRVPVEKHLAKANEHFAESLDDELPNRMKVKVVTAPANTAPTGNPGAIVLRTRFTEIDPGEASARVFSLGFAGATHVTMQGEFTDGGTGKVLLRFSHHNYHSKAGIVNLYSAALEENEEQIAESLSKLLKAFYP